MVVQQPTPEIKLSYIKIESIMSNHYFVKFCDMLLWTHSKHKLVLRSKPSIDFCINSTEQSLCIFYHFLLAKFYHLLTIYFGVGYYCLSNSLTSSHNPAHYIGLESLKRTKNLLQPLAPQEGPNQQVHTSYPTLQAIEAYPKGRHTHQLSPQLSPYSLSSPS